MTKIELVDKVYAKASLPTKVMAEEAVDVILNCIRDELVAGNSVVFTGFGSFKVNERAARPGHNPQTGQPITIPATRVVKFTPGKSLKDAVK